MSKKPRPVSVRMDADIYDRVQAHRANMQETMPHRVEVTTRAAVEDLLLIGLKAVGR